MWESVRQWRVCSSPKLQTYWNIPKGHQDGIGFGWRKLQENKTEQKKKPNSSNKSEDQKLSLLIFLLLPDWKQQTESCLYLFLCRLTHVFVLFQLPGFLPVKLQSLHDSLRLQRTVEEKFKTLTLLLQLGGDSASSRGHHRDPTSGNDMTLSGKNTNSQLWPSRWSSCPLVLLLPESLQEPAGKKKPKFSIIRVSSNSCV